MGPDSRVALLHSALDIALDIADLYKLNQVSNKQIKQFVADLWSGMTACYLPTRGRGGF